MLTRPRLTFALHAACCGKRRHARSAVVAGVFAFAVLNFGLGLMAERYPRTRDPIYGDKLAKLRRPAGTPLVVALGTSRTNFAFHGLRVEERLREAGRPATAFNFGVPASGPVTHLLYFRRLMRDGVKPDLLLLEILPSMFRDLPGEPPEGKWLLGDRLTHGELDAVEGFGFGGDVRERWRVSTFTPWYGLRFQLLARVVPSWVPWNVRYDWGRNTDARGWGTPPFETLTAEQRASGAAQARAEYAGLLHDWTPGGPPVDALRTLLAECREQGVPVKLVLMPEGSTFRSWYSPAVLDRLHAFLRTLDCDVIDAREWLPDEVFTDGHHQLRIGAEAFSDRLTREAILPWLGGR